MSLLIAEIGGSSSRWAFLDGQAPEVILPLAGEAMPGFNPLSGDAERFMKGIMDYISQRFPSALTARQVFAYGAGCGAPERAGIMRTTLRELWPSADIAVRSDLEGAARGLWGNEKGLVLVLGTGSSAGWWDGAFLHQHFPSLGYVLGDEGSGADIGRALLQDAFYRRMPDDIRVQLFGLQGPELADVLDAVYRSPFPSRELAAFAGRLAVHAEEPYARELITSRFQAFIEAFKPFHEHGQMQRVKATGSVAWGFREILSHCLLEHGMELLDVERDPLNGLIRWHRGQLA